MSNTACIAEESYAFEVNDTYGNVVRESFDVGRRRGPTFDKPLDVAYYGYLYETSWLLQSLTTGAVVASASAFDSVNGQSDM